MSGPPSVCPPRSCSRFPPDESSRHPSCQRSPDGTALSFTQNKRGLLGSVPFFEESKWDSKKCEENWGWCRILQYLPEFTQNGYHEIGGFLNFHSLERTSMPSRSRIHLQGWCLHSLRFHIPEETVGLSSGMHKGFHPLLHQWSQNSPI